jgi:formylglycine-generating enzyme required for sulfatase activity
MWGFLPYEWEAQQARPSRPVVNVSWYQATAFCAWLTEKLTRLQGVKREILLPVGHVVRLPTEAEWEFTARGPGGRRYPWGNQPPGAEHANFKGRVGRPSPVGIFPFGTTPEGVVDMAGNTWEWCLDRYAEGFYRRCAKLARIMHRGWRV